jgi:hypothetical protein
MQRLQRRLAVGSSHDPLEREADRMADHLGGAGSHRGGGDDVEERFAAPASVEQVLATPGTPLDARLGTEMGQRFGHDFARVRVHAGDAAARSAQDVNALAYTVGHHVVFGAQMYQPATTAGRRLIAHELAHVVQQSGSPASSAGPAQPVVQRAIPDPHHTRHLTGSEVQEVQLVFGSALKTENVTVSEGGLMTLGGYARTVPNHIYFPSGSIRMPLMIHELTHVWQYQRGEGWGSLPGMIWEAIVANYDYGGEEGLKEARAKGQSFSEFTTEQQGDILQDYYVRLKLRLDVSAYEPWVNDVKTGRENVHHYPTVEPLPAATIDVWKLNREYRDRQEAALIVELRRPLLANDPRYVARANRLFDFFKDSTWATYYRERIVDPRPDDELVKLLYLRLTDTTRKRIFALLKVPPNR